MSISCRACKTPLPSTAWGDLCAWCTDKLPAIPLQGIVDDYCAGLTHRQTAEKRKTRPREPENAIYRLRKAGIHIERGAEPPTIPRNIFGPKGRSRQDLAVRIPPQIKRPTP